MNNNRILPEYIETLKNAALDECLQELCDISGCRNVGIRIQEGADYPFCRTCGYSHAFLARERSLLNGHPYPACICAAAAAGTSTVYNNHASPYGSYFQARLPAAPELFTILPAFRGTCLKHGFNTLGIIPVRGTDRRAYGIFHIADTAPNRLNEELQETLEQKARQLAEALAGLYCDNGRAAKPSVVIVDDSLLNALLVKEVIGEACGAFAYFTDAAAAQEHISRHTPDILITELLTDRNGCDFIDAVRREAGANTPEIVVFTATAPDERRPELMAARGINYVLEKPVADMDVFKHIIADITSRRNA